MSRKNPEQHSAFLLTNKAPRLLKVKSAGRKVTLGSQVSSRGFFIEGRKQSMKSYLDSINPRYFIPAVILMILLFMVIFAKAAEPIILTASWYSTASLKQEGTYKYSKGVMANGHKFSDDGFTAACRLYPINTILRVVNISTKKSVIVKVTDRIGKRFAKTRIDLSKRAFSVIAPLKQGLAKVSIRVVK
jgi:rare lipoprotein A